MNSQISNSSKRTNPKKENKGVPKMLFIYESTLSAFKKTGNKLMDNDTKTEIDKYSDGFTRLLNNNKLTFYSIFDGKFKDNNNPFKFYCKASILPATKKEIMDDHKIK